MSSGDLLRVLTIFFVKNPNLSKVSHQKWTIVKSTHIMWLSELRFLRLFFFEFIGTLHSLHSSTFNFLSLNSSTFKFLQFNFQPLFSLQFSFGHFIFHNFVSLLDCYFLCLIVFLSLALSHMFISVLGVLTLILFTLILILKVWEVIRNCFSRSRFKVLNERFQVFNYIESQNFWSYWKFCMIKTMDISFP